MEAAGGRILEKGSNFNCGQGKFQRTVATPCVQASRPLQHTVYETCSSPCGEKSSQVVFSHKHNREGLPIDYNLSVAAKANLNG